MLGLSALLKNERWAFGQISKKNDIGVCKRGDWDAPGCWLRSYGGQERDNGYKLASKFHDADYNTGTRLFFPGISRKTLVLYNYSGELILILIL